MAGPASRLVYLDWLRGLAVLVMVQAHVVDSWTRANDRADVAYYSAVFVGGLGAPLFLFLAGVAVVLSAYARSRATGDPSIGARAALRRGGDVFVLGLLFRVQSQLLGWGALTNLFKVDILNVMGLSMIVAAWCWRLAGSRANRIALFAVATALVTLTTPIVRDLGWLATLPDPIEAYLRPEGRYAAFSLFPWAGFLLAGALAGELIDRSRALDSERRLQVALFAVGVGGVLLAWWASFQPAVYSKADFWTSSPTFFFIRLGIITALVPAGWAHCRFWLETAEGVPETIATKTRSSRRRFLPRRFLRDLRGDLLGKPFVALTRAVELMGRSSLFVYWIHVEMVYGVIAEPLKRTLPLWGALAATLLMCMWLYVLVLGKNRWLRGFELPKRMRIFAAVLR